MSFDEKRLEEIRGAFDCVRWLNSPSWKMAEDLLGMVDQLRRELGGRDLMARAILLFHPEPHRFCGPRNGRDQELLKQAHRAARATVSPEPNECE